MYFTLAASISAVLVQLTIHDTADSLRAVCGDHAGCALKRGNFCEVHVMRPQIGYPQDFVVIGHEFWHCWFEDFHG